MFYTEKARELIKPVKMLQIQVVLEFTYSFAVTSVATPYMTKLSWFIGTSYLPQFQKRAVTNLKKYSTKNEKKLQKSKAEQ